MWAKDGAGQVRPELSELRNAELYSADAVKSFEHRSFHCLPITKLRYVALQTCATTGRRGGNPLLDFCHTRPNRS
jgi:hypothetical protein